MTMVIKRDGRKVAFDKQKIIDAILKAFQEVDVVDEYAKTKAENIAAYIEQKVIDSDKEWDIETIQDYVEKGLSSIKKKHVAKAYILYREERNKARNKTSQLFKTINEKLLGSNIENSNANMDEGSFGGRKGEAANALLKEIALNEHMSETTRNNHINNMIYVHDLDSYSLGEHNCLTIPFEHLLKDGFNTRQTDIRKAGSISTAFQLLAVIFQIQSLQQFG